MQFTKRTPKICQACGEQFLAKKSNAQFCSLACRPSAQYVVPTSGMTTTKCGAHSELIACAYLLRKGCNVYRAVNWTSKADLVAVRGNEVIRVQVRTGTYINANGTFGYANPGGDDHDLLLVIDHGGNVVIEEYRTGRQSLPQAA